MHPKYFIENLDETKIAASSCRAEQITSGEIRVVVSHRRRVDALAAAERRFLELGMTRTPLRNAVLIYFAPLAQAFALWGDIGVNEKCKGESWQAIADRISPRLKAGQISDAVNEAVRDVGELLARHFPRDSADQNHLPDTVLRD